MGSVPEESVAPVVAAAEEVVFRSRLPDIEIPNEQTLQSYCFGKMAEVGSRPCIIDGQTGASYTYAETESLTRRAAAGLRRMGVGKGDVVMNLLRNCPEFAFSFLGAARLGAATTTANPFYTPHEIHRQADAAGARLIVTEACAVDKVLEYAAGKGLPVVTVDGKRDGCVEFSELIAGEELPEADEAEIQPDDVVALPYSSGTTGLPKGVMLTHRSLITSVAQQVDGENPNLHFTKDDVLLCLLPLFHIYSLNSVLLAGLRAGSAIVIMRKFDIGALVDLVRTHRITVAPFVPPIVVEIAKSPRITTEDLASIRFVMSGAAPMGKDIQDAFMAKIPNAVLGQGYGMTEAGPVLAMCLAFAKEPFPVKSGSCGTVVRNAGLKIVDPDTGASLGRNQPGEICIRGEQIMKGYLNDPESTKNTIDKDGWLHTGDIGFVDDDDEIFIVDRLKEIIKYKGFQVAPAELEALLITHPEIKDAAVVSLKDDLAGEVPVAFVMPIEGSEITEDEIKKFVAKEVYLYGGQVISWKNNAGEQQLFVSRKASFKPPKAIRGGIQICFPQLGNHGVLGQHGFARNRLWSVDESPPLPDTTSDCHIDLILKHSEEDLKIWPHSYELRLKVALSPRGDLILTSRIRNTNADGKPFQFTFAYHTYFSVSDISEVRVEGLDTLDYHDNLQSKIRCTEQGDAVVFESEVDRIYLSAPPKIVTIDHEKKRTFVLRKKELPDVVVWNPWDRKAKAMPDFGAEEYKCMLCVGAARIEKPITLRPGEEWQGMQEISPVPSSYSSGLLDPEMIRQMQRI